MRPVYYEGISLRFFSRACVEDVKGQQHFGSTTTTTTLKVNKRSSSSKTGRAVRRSTSLHVVFEDDLERVVLRGIFKEIVGMLHLRHRKTMTDQLTRRQGAIHHQLHQRGDGVTMDQT